MSDMEILNRINSPDDVKKLSEKELPELAKEIRQTIVETVSKNGGHLSSNLGIVELSIALHRVFNSPQDNIIFDVGHQSYTHKILTGRYKDFSTLRTENGISGFLRPNESEHDCFYSGHSSVSISEAYGLSVSKKLKGDKGFVISVIGDGALTGGLAYEALNNAGRAKTNLIVILNDNEMSISKNVGFMAKYLAVMRSKPGYFKFKHVTEKILNKIPFIGKPLSKLLFKSKTALKNLIYQSTFFEDMGFRYMGPIDGHNIKNLTEALESAKTLHSPVFLHVLTVKGKGYDFAEKDPSIFHGVSNFDIDTGKINESKKTFSSEFGDFICNVAEKDKRICVITAAMSLGTGLKSFSEKFPDRFFDVGIAEEHAVTFSSGIAVGDMIPVFSVYSTFLQRCYDQLVHDVALQNKKIILAIDRAGFVGEDGETHHGLFDVSFLNTMPNIKVYSPTTLEEMKGTFINAFYHNNDPVAIRYYRGSEVNVPENLLPSANTFDLFEKGKNQDIIVTYGRLYGFACEVYNQLDNIDLLKINCIKPIDDNIIDKLLGYKNIFFFEEGQRHGGVGEILASKLLEAGFKGRYNLTAVDNPFVPQASVDSQLKHHLLDTEGMIKVITGK